MRKSRHSCFPLQPVQQKKDVCEKIVFISSAYSQKPNFKKHYAHRETGVHNAF